MVGLKKVLGKNKEEDAVYFDLGNQPAKPDDPISPQRQNVQTFNVPAEQLAPVQTVSEKTEPGAEKVQVSEIKSGSKSIGLGQGEVTDQLQDLSSNLKNLVYDFRSFMSESGSPFNPNDIPSKPDEGEDAGRANVGYISAPNMPRDSREVFENPQDVDSKFQERYVNSGDGLGMKLLESANAAPSTTVSQQIKEALDKTSHGTKFSKDLKSNLDSTDMPALMRAVNSTDYLLHAVGRKNLLKILEVGTREGWIRPEVERLVLSVSEIISNAGVEVQESAINVNDLMRVVYFLNRLLDPEISDFLTINQPAVKRRR
ncbi:MAG TPA: hypothetical protein VK503_04805 [Candidatus Bathyarchaeia archaeon]|nr:hypothetical protein [Candidatus Bathyarchaeia archaeon]